MTTLLCNSPAPSEFEIMAPLEITGYHFCVLSRERDAYQYENTAAAEVNYKIVSV